MRRMLRRMQTVGVHGFEAYRDYLEVHPKEFALLFNTILINVTSFFRDPQAWEFLEKQVLPEMLGSKGTHAPVRVWSAGCASGQEAYSIAMLLAEALGDEAFRARVKVYGTDADEDALTQARRAAYASKDTEDVPPRLRERYFEQVNGRYVFRQDLRRSVIFGRHDLVQDAPISRLDLLVCPRFHFALNGHGNGAGYLFLGRAEMLLTQSSLFAPLELKCRVFSKVQPPGTRQRTPALARSQRQRRRDGPQPTPARDGARGYAARPDHHRYRGYAGAGHAEGAAALHAQSQGHRPPAPGPGDLLRPAELRSLIEQAYGERRPVVRTSVERRFGDGASQFLDITAQPLYDESHLPLGVSVTFLDVTRNHQLLDDLQRSREEVQTTNEELETTNEELQSTNEELETMNEELRSTNDELQAVNEQLRQRTDELNHANSFLESVLASLPAARRSSTPTTTS
jgi:two-component system CheB/CheR fusion protein